MAAMPSQTLLTTLLTIIAMVMFSLRSPFDPMHPKRLYVLHVENVSCVQSPDLLDHPQYCLPGQTTSLEQHLHIGAADGAPGFNELAKSVAERFSIPGTVPTPVVMDEYNGDWDILYPFSAVSATSVPARHGHG